MIGYFESLEAFRTWLDYFSDPNHLERLRMDQGMDQIRDPWEYLEKLGAERIEGMKGDFVAIVKEKRIIVFSPSAK